MKVLMTKNGMTHEVFEEDLKRFENAGWVKVEVPVTTVEPKKVKEKK